MTKFFYSFWTLCIFFITTFYFSILQSYRVSPGTLGSPKTIQELFEEKYNVTMATRNLPKFISNFKLYNSTQKSLSVLEDHEKLVYLTSALDINSMSAHELREHFKKDRIGMIVVPEDFPIFSKVIPQLFQKPFFVMKQYFHVRPVVWIFLMPFVHGPFKSFNRLLNSGIFHFWQKLRTYNLKKWYKFFGLISIFKNEPEGCFLDWEYASQTLKTQDDDVTFALALRDDLIRGAFYFFLIGVAWAFLAFAGEIGVYYIWIPLERKIQLFRTIMQEMEDRNRQQDQNLKELKAFKSQITLLENKIKKNRKQNES